MPCSASTSPSNHEPTMTIRHALARGGKFAAIAAAVSLAGCKNLLAVERVGLITDANVTSAAAADALRIGVLGSLNGMTGGGTAWVYSGLLTDEFKSSAPQQQSPEID